jgi:hypothetical protein
MTVWRMRIAGWVPKASNAHSECEILIAPALQQWLDGRLLNVMLWCKYILCLAIGYEGTES